MNDTPQQASTPAEQAEIDYGSHLIWRLLGSRITQFGGNAEGEVLLTAEKNGEVIELIIGKDEAGEVTLYEVERAGAAE